MNVLQTSFRLITRRLIQAYRALYKTLRSFEGSRAPASSFQLNERANVESIDTFRTLVSVFFLLHPTPGTTPSFHIGFDGRAVAWLASMSVCVRPVWRVLIIDGLNDRNLQNLSV